MNIDDDDDDLGCVFAFELIVAIMDHCDPQTLCRMACVCTGWRNYLMDAERVQERKTKALRFLMYPGGSYSILPNGAKHGQEWRAEIPLPLDSVGNVDAWLADEKSTEAEWRDGKLHGKAKVLRGTTVSSMTFVNSVPHGTFSSDSDGSAVCHRLISVKYGKLDGREVTAYPSVGAIMTNSWKKGRLHGKSRTQRRSSVCDSRWKHGRMDGTEKYYESHGSDQILSRVSFWRNGVQVAELNRYLDEDGDDGDDNLDWDLTKWHLDRSCSLDKMHFSVPSASRRGQINVLPTTQKSVYGFEAALSVQNLPSRYEPPPKRVMTTGADD